MEGYDYRATQDVVLHKHYEIRQNKRLSALEF